jgi:hypothetical protein
VGSLIFRSESRCQSFCNSFFLVTVDELGQQRILYKKRSLSIVVAHCGKAMFIESLKKLGFSEREAQVYLTLLKVGPSPASTLASRVGMKRVTVYNVLDALRERGIVTFGYSGKCRKYIPHGPECLLKDLEQESLDLEGKLMFAKKFVSNLKKDFKWGAIFGSEVVLFEGGEAILEALQGRVDEKSALFVLNGVSDLDLSIVDVFLKDFFGKSECAFVAPVDVSDMLNVAILFQKDKMFFVSFSDGKAEMLFLRNTMYSSFLKETLLRQYFDEITTS